MQLFRDAISFIQTLSFTDYIFFFAVLVLMLLIISLIYFIFDNQSDEIEINLPTEKQENELMQLEMDDEKTAITNITELNNAIEQRPEDTISLNDYEVEQEEKAIISYDELVKRKNGYAINYSEEEKIEDDLSVKKVDLDHLLNKEVEVKSNMKVTVISYEKEEAFLEALKALQQKLN